MCTYFLCQNYAVLMINYICITFQVRKSLRIRSNLCPGPQKLWWLIQLYIILQVQENRNLNWSGPLRRMFISALLCTSYCTNMFYEFSKLLLYRGKLTRHSLIEDSLLHHDLWVLATLSLSCTVTTQQKW